MGLMITGDLRVTDKPCISLENRVIKGVDEHQALHSGEALAGSTVPSSKGVFCRPSVSGLLYSPRSHTLDEARSVPAARTRKVVDRPMCSVIGPGMLGVVPIEWCGQNKLA